MCYPVCGVMHIKEPSLLIGKSSPCGSSMFPFSLSEWSFTICLMPYNHKLNVLSVSLNKTFPSFLNIWAGVSLNIHWLFFHNAFHIHLMASSWSVYLVFWLGCCQTIFMNVLIIFTIYTHLCLTRNIWLIFAVVNHSLIQKK